MSAEKKPRKVQHRNVVPLEIDDALHAAIEAVSQEIGEKKAVVMRLAIRAGLEAARQALLKLSGNADESKYPAHTPRNLLLNETDKAKKPKP